MILVTRLNGSQFYINAELIQTVESTPDTVISLTTNLKVVVKEEAQEVIRRIIEYKQLTTARPTVKTTRNRRGE